MIDNSRARGLQAMYHAGAVGALNALAEECTRIAFILVKTICRKKALRFSRDRMEEIAHDAAALIIARFLKCPDYTVRKFYSAQWDAVQCVMFDSHRRKQKSFEKNQVSLPVGIRASEAQLTEPVNPSTALDELVSDHPAGKRIAIDLSRSKSYSMAVRRIACYVERQWINEHAEALHEVCRVLHWKAGKAGGVSRTGLDAVRQAPSLRKKTSPRREPLEHTKGEGSAHVVVDCR